MQFPTYFGANWDAFDECITDLTWCPAEKYVILYDDADIFAQAEPTQYQIAVDILNSAKEYWESCENVRCPDPRLLREVGDLIFHE